MKRYNAITDVSRILVGHYSSEATGTKVILVEGEGVVGGSASPAPEKELSYLSKYSSAWRNKSRFEAPSAGREVIDRFS